MEYTIAMEHKRIDSPANETVKSLVRLHKKKERDATGRFLVEGAHLLQEAARAGLLETVYCLPEYDPAMDAETIYCSQRVLDKLSLQESGARMIGVARMPQWTDVLAFPRILMLDDVQDPGNLGTLVRSACSFGTGAVICSAGCADPYNPKTVQASQGAVFHIPVVRTDLLPVIAQLKKDRPVYGAALHHDSIPLQQLQPAPSYALVLGNEGQGIHEYILDACTSIVHIEMDAFESLNVGVAGSILLYMLRYDR